MTGQELYELYAKANRDAINCGVDIWEDLTEDDHTMWNHLAKLINQGAEA